jgi:hypothetical protein
MTGELKDGVIYHLEDCDVAVGSCSDSYEADHGGSLVRGCGTRRHVNCFVRDSDDVRVY